MTPNHTPNDPLRRIAVLISGLDPKTADLLLEQLDEAQAARIRQAVMELGDVTHYEEQQVLHEFRGACVQDRNPTPSDPVNSETLNDEQPFELLRDATPRSVAKLLSREHPQVVAVVLAHLAPEAAADVVSYWPPGVQADVLSRVAHLDELHPDALRSLEDAIAGLLAGQAGTRVVRTAGVSAVESIVANLKLKDRADVLAQIARRDSDLAATLNSSEEDEPALTQPTPPATPPPAAAPRRPHVEFEDLESLSATGWATLLHSVQGDTMLLALAGAPEGVLQALQRLAPPTLLRSLDKRLRNLGPIQLEDIDRAQKEIAETAAEQIAAGRLAPIERRHFAAAI